MIIAKAPILFILAVALVTAAIWRVMQWIYSERLESTRQLLDFYMRSYGPIGSGDGSQPDN